MEIRRLGPNDESLLEAVGKELLGLVDPSAGMISREGLSRALTSSSCYFLAALSKSRPIGYLSAFRFPSVTHDGDLAYLYDIVVGPTHRRKGVARLLIKTLKQYCQTDGVIRIWVGTALENHAARRTFEATGAVLVSETYAEYVFDLPRVT